MERPLTGRQLYERYGNLLAARFGIRGSMQPPWETVDDLMHGAWNDLADWVMRGVVVRGVTERSESPTPALRVVDVPEEGVTVIIRSGQHG